MLNRIALVPLALVAQAILVALASGREHPPAMPDLAAFPASISDWQRISEQPIAQDIRDQLAADRLLCRLYVNSPTGSAAELLVAWFQSQRGGKTQPHSPAVCLPGAGFTPDESGVIRLDTAEGTIPANLYVASSTAGQRAVVLYWYQTPRRILAGEWESKFWLVPDAIRDHRTDVALVRVVAWVSDDLQGAKDTASAFAKAVFPVLRGTLPR